ncbi:MAG: HPr kinase/phosphatase C-terminal domain-containing protein [Hyphomicrobiales bacterium]|nr:HPr kinase/phosphatase C-terminal domain-containing protein [Hyphomicrobiales bacterium]
MTPDWQNIHATAVLVGRKAVLIRGAAGSGKSSLALALIRRGARENRLIRLVADDQVFVAAVNGALIAQTPETIAGLIEERRNGIVSCAYEGLARIGLAIDLVAVMAKDEAPTATIAGISLPRIAISADDPAVLERVDIALFALQHGNRLHRHDDLRLHRDGDLEKIGPTAR